MHCICVTVKFSKLALCLTASARCTMSSLRCSISKLPNHCVIYLLFVLSLSTTKTCDFCSRQVLSSERVRASKKLRYPRGSGCGWIRCFLSSLINQSAAVHCDRILKHLAHLSSVRKHFISNLLDNNNKLCWRRTSDSATAYCKPYYYTLVANPILS
jgi:hypothetical protein